MSRKMFEIDAKTSDMIYKLGLMGKTNQEISEFFGIAESTFYKHLLKNPSVSEALKRARAGSDSDVVAALYQRATGFTRTMPDGLKQYFPPDVTAAIFWLKNRQPEAWRDVRKNEVTGKEGSPLLPPIINFVSDEEGGKGNGCETSES